MTILGQPFLFLLKTGSVGQAALDHLADMPRDCPVEQPLRLQIDQPEVIIRPRLDPIGIVDRVDIPELVKLGELATQAALPEIHRAVSWQSRLARRISDYSHRLRGTGYDA